MEVSLINSGDIEADAILSIRAGSVRRQAPVSSGRPFRFPKAPTGETPLKIDILKQVGSAYLVQKPGEDQYKVEFSGDFKGKCIEVEIKKTEDGAATAAVAADGEEEEKETSKGAKAAKDYLEGHQVLQFVQAVLQTVIKEKPADPFAYMAKHFMSGYGPTDTKTPKKAPAEAPAEAAAAAAAPEVPAPEDAPAAAPAAAPAEAPAEAPAAATEAPAAFSSSGPVDISCLTRIAKDDLGLLPQPAEPKFKMALAEIYVRSAPYGGSDKSSNGHRYDSIPFANGMINSGMSCQLIHYVHDEHDKFFEVAKNFDAIIVRCNPGQIKADGGDQAKYDNGMRELRKLGKQVWPSPDVMEFMGAKDALCKVATMNIGLEDTLAYYSEESFAEGFKKTMAFQPRVIKQNRGSSGEGIWIIKLKSGSYCSTYGERSCADDEVLEMMEANDNHAEEHTVGEFIEFCVNGRTEKSGEWASKGVGKYLEGGKEAGGQLVDQRFCPRIVEGELRYNMVVDVLVGIIHKKPKEGGISAVGGTGSVYTFYGPTEEKYKHVSDKFQAELPKLMASLELPVEPLPLWWTSDFINASPQGVEAKDEQWIVGEFNCSCVGISACLKAFCNDENPNAKFTDIPAEELAEATKYGQLIGKKAKELLEKSHPSAFPVDISSVTRVAKNYQGQMLQPAAPKYKIALVQVYVRPAEFGGSDKSYNHHRYDSMPFANGCIEAGMSCQMVHYVHEEHDKFFQLMLKFDALIVRCNPGQIAADGGDQAKFDGALRELRQRAIGVWPSPDVMEFMGAKDALVKVKDLSIGLPDTLAYYGEKEFAEGFKKTMAFQPRVIKQNRGSAGEGIWIIKLKNETYCPNYGDRSCEDTEVLTLMEANDNHEEEHTVAEFIEFCTNGKTAAAGTWTSKGEGKYLEGGKAKGGQLVDQRFCPRIVEGELRYNMVCDALLGIIHKKPKEGGISAVSGTGSVYTYYKPEEEKFESLTNRFLKEDLAKVMPALGLAEEPIPLWWTSDFILASEKGTPVKDEKWIVGEFNCSCVGISKCLAAYCKPDTPKASYFDITPEDLEEAKAMGKLIGQKALKILDEVTLANSKKAIVEVKEKPQAPAPAAEVDVSGANKQGSCCAIS